MRGKSAVKRKIDPDYKYNSVVIAKFSHYLMKDGKKSVAQKVIYGAFDIIAEKTKKNPVEVFEGAMKNVTPLLEVRSKRVGGANYQVPFPVRGDRRYSLAFRWLLAAARARKGMTMKEKLAYELIDAFNKEGAAIKKRDDIHRMAEANKAFAHFRW